MAIRAILTAAAVAAAVSSVPAAASEWIKDSLREAASAHPACTAERAAAKSTLRRISDLRLPERGKVIVVNIPSGIVTAYEDGVPVIESKAVVGKAGTPTPELDTRVTFVRPNPTWTVPRSIVERNRWRDKLADDPGFFEDNNFRIVSNGASISPWEASSRPGDVESFVQMPGAGNALGSVKIGIDNNQAIYLHDTNDPGKFDAEVRAASAGCVRIEKIGKIAAWTLGLAPLDLETMIADGVTENMVPSEPVRVILGYWTAWPDASGWVRFYPDIYGKDDACDPAGVEGRRSGESRHPGPRFIPYPLDTGNQPARWTEYEAR